MSRDFTPQELHRADVMAFRERGIHLYEGTFVWVDSDGMKRPFVHKDYQYKDMFPSLSFLGEGIAYTLIETYHTDRNFIKEIEDILTKIREEDVPDGTIHEDEYGSGTEKTVYEWYRGLSLGSIQYDSRYNNEAFIEKAVGIFRKTLAEKDLFPDRSLTLKEEYWSETLSGYTIKVSEEQKRILYERIPSDARPVPVYEQADGEMSFGVEYQEGLPVPYIGIRSGDDFFVYYEHEKELLKPDERDLLIGKINTYEYIEHCYDDIDEMR